MEELILEAIKKEYNIEKEKQSSLKKLYDRLLELETNEAVKEYLFITEQLENIDIDKKLRQSDNDIITTKYCKYLKDIKETNKIYVYLGTFRINDEIDVIHGSYDNRVSYNNELASYRLYRDIEQKYEMQIPINQTKKFEKENIILYPKSYFCESYYYKIQKEFFKDCVFTDQKSAVKKLIKNYTKNKK